MHWPIFIFSIALLAACAETENFEKHELKDESDWEMKSYLSCVETAAVRFAEADVSPTEGSIAAQGHCSLEFTKYQDATRDFMMASVNSGDWKAVAAKRATELTEEIKKKATESAVSRIVEARMIKASSARQP